MSRKNRKNRKATVTVTATNNTPQTMTTMTAYTWNDLDNELNALLASWAEPELELTKPEEFAHLSSIELAQMCDHLGINSHGTHQQLCWRLADAENGTLSPTLLVANNPNPKVVLAPTKPQTCQAEPKPEPTKGSTYKGAYGHEPASEYVPAPVTLVNGIDLSLCSYRDLQAKCKLAGLKANGSREVLIERLLNPTEADRPAAKKATKKSTKNGKCKQVQAPTAAPTSTTAEALTYRQAQKLNSWANDNVVWNKPCKNSGWDNIRTNLLDLVTTDHFTNLMADKAQVKELAIHLQVPATQLNALITATITA